MSILLVDPPVEPGVAVVRRLVAQGDQVRVLCAAGEADRWRELGAHVATGDPGDVDLLAAAGTGARTIVLLHERGWVTAVAAARICGADRIVGLTPDPSSPAPGADIDHVVLVRRKRRLGRGNVVSDERIAEAVDAADDLAGSPRLVLDLDQADAWERLGLS